MWLFRFGGSLARTILRVPRAAAMQAWRHPFAAFLLLGLIALAANRLFALREYREIAEELKQERAKSAEQDTTIRETAFTARLQQVANTDELSWRKKKELLENSEVCPPELRDFAWGYRFRQSNLQRACFPSTDLDVPDAVALSADGKVVAAAVGQELRVWELPSQKARFMVKLKNRLAGFIADELHFLPELTLNADGKTLVCGRRLWNAVTGDELPPVGEPNSYRQALSAGGAFLALQYGQNPESAVVKIWDVATRAKKGEFSGACVQSAAPDGDDLFVASPGTGNTTKLINAVTGKEIGVLPFAPKPLMTLNADASLLAFMEFFADEEWGWRIWDLNRKRMRHSSASLDQRHSGGANLTFSADGTVLAAGRCVWDASTGRKRLEIAEAYERRIGLSADGKLLVVPHYGPPYPLAHCVDLWDVSINGAHSGLTSGNVVKELAFTNDDRAILFWGRKESEVTAGGIVQMKYGKGELKIVDVATARELDLLPWKCENLVFAAISPDGELLVTEATAKPRPEKPDERMGSDIELWEVNARKRRWATTERNPNATRYSCFFNSKGTVVGFWVSLPNEHFPGSRSRKIVQWNARTGQMIGALDDAFFGTELSYSPNGRILAAESHSRIDLIDTAKNESFCLTPGGSASYMGHGLAWSPDGRFLASRGCSHGPKDAAKEMKKVRIWDVEAKKLHAAIGEAAFAINAMAFHPDGKTLALGGDNGEVALWNVATGQERALLHGHEAAVTALAFSHDGKTLASGDASGAVWLWKAEFPSAE
jgi:WD40 repeat protein